ncbi:hypothetical protein [Longirhabdus pacifica]|uniref:hypothetical protein n=1 Tax=Longirhabdus pacifica TaxID=2305227 RepID=UPI0013E8DF77|nr:hypothetical protein [Longirhabdus pacifica]
MSNIHHLPVPVWNELMVNVSLTDFNLYQASIQNIEHGAWCVFFEDKYSRSSLKQVVRTEPGDEIDVLFHVGKQGEGIAPMITYSVYFINEKHQFINYGMNEVIHPEQLPNIERGNYHVISARSHPAPKSAVMGVLNINKVPTENAKTIIIKKKLNQVHHMKVKQKEQHNIYFENIQEIRHSLRSILNQSSNLKDVLHENDKKPNEMKEMIQEEIKKVTQKGFKALKENKVTEGEVTELKSMKPKEVEEIKEAKVTEISPIIEEVKAEERSDNTEGERLHAAKEVKASYIVENEGRKVKQEEEVKEARQEEVVNDVIQKDKQYHLASEEPTHVIKRERVAEDALAEANQPQVDKDNISFIQQLIKEQYTSYEMAFSNSMIYVSSYELNKDTIRIQGYIDIFQKEKLVSTNKEKMVIMTYFVDDVTPVMDVQWYQNLNFKSIIPISTAVTPESITITATIIFDQNVLFPQPTTIYL